MQFKTIAFLLLSATTALANPKPQEIDIDLGDITSLIGEIPTSLPTDFLDDLKSFSKYIPPPGIASVLETALPSEVRQSIEANPTNAYKFNTDLYSSLKAGQTPEWYGDLPSDVKSYLNMVGGLTGTANGPQATGAGAGGEPASASGNYAARPTGAVAASLAGAAGILGLAILL
ncbi:predicted protein [Uncinocarpus reesii 1704]|uniref:Uncharacterized protein n=1 Tax=Uncinocarpus reesii (strain UAMH 1704) TaxID=336963 RepID=C4JQY5_UNCRE|nr:uncharacterized protein UREG_03467 [Uncinocarpus reesii 1704]EEP78621.1 predicted protein [Uncinocarpus reesii 1704]